MRAEPVVLPGSEGASQAYRNVLTLPPGATAAWGGTFFRSAATVGFIGFAFDPHDGKDQEGSHAFEWGGINGRAQPPRRRISRKFNDDAHVELISLVAAQARFGRRQAVIKNRTWLTAS
jgi:hypothetical protein